MLRSIDKVYELYLQVLLLLSDLADADRSDAEELHTKYFPKEEELNAARRLHQLQFILALDSHEGFKREVKKRSLSWQKEHDLVRKIFLEVKKSEDYLRLLRNETQDEKEFLSQLVRNHLLGSEALNTYLDESNIYWSDDFDFICHMIIKNIQGFYDQGSFQLFSLYKDETDDQAFVKELFSKTVLSSKEFEEAIADKTRNWDLERIALVDIIILKMALAELVSFPGIPVKVTINEYIDLSKEYSTPKSKQFVNGVIDKLAQEFKEQGKIVKTGRGLIG